MQTGPLPSHLFDLVQGNRYLQLLQYMGTDSAFLSCNCGTGCVNCDACAVLLSPAFGVFTVKFLKAPKMSELSPPEQHRNAGPSAVRCAVITVSDTRTLETDSSGALICRLLEQAGHSVMARSIVPDGPAELGPLLDHYKLHHAGNIQAILMTGGTGIAPRDLTPEVVRQRIDAELPGFGELFRMLSWEQVGAAAMLSRAFAGRMGRSIVFLMPGSRNAVQLAMEKLILPELSHLVGHL